MLPQGPGGTGLPPAAHVGGSLACVWRAGVSARGAGSASGTLAALALPPFGLWPLAFAALVPLGVYLAGSLRTRDAAVRAGLWFAGVYYGVVLHWIPFTLHGMTPFGALLGLLALGVLTLTGGFLVLALHRLLGADCSPLIAIPAVWVVAEGLLARAGPLAMPWTPLGLALAGSPALATPAEWGGVSVLTLWLGLVNGALVCCLCRPRDGLGLRVLGTVVLVLGPMFFGRVRTAGLPTEDGAPVWVAAIPMTRAELLEPGRRDLAAAESLVRISAALRPGLATQAPGQVAILLPEAPFQASWSEGMEERIVQLAAEAGVPVLAGSLVLAETAPDQAGPQLRNGVVLVDPGGRTELIHGKVRLVPGVESNSLAPGPRGGVFQLAGGLAAGVVICFEAAFGRDVRKLRRSGASLLVNPSNEGWFTPVFPLLGAAARAQHRAHLVLRAVETRMAVLKPSVGGELLALGADGGRVRRLRPRNVTVEEVIPPISPATTLYVRFGDLGGLSGLALLLAAAAPLLLGRIRRRSRA